MSWPAFRPGDRHYTAIIGDPPEHRDWTPESPNVEPEIADDCLIGAYVTIDAGLNRATRIGARTWLMKKVHIGHDALIGAGCEIAPGAVVCGECEVGDGVKIGVNACLRPFVKVGDGARIGCGAVVVDDVPPGETWAGNPARCLSSSPALSAAAAS